MVKKNLPANSHGTTVTNPVPTSKNRISPSRNSGNVAQYTAQKIMPSAPDRSPKSKVKSKAKGNGKKLQKRGSILLSWRLVVISLFALLLSPVIYYIDTHAENFYIFETAHLHDLSRRAIAAHGNNTRSVVQYIVSELHARHPKNVNVDEEWMFNNAGGAMGAMYIIHASVTEYVIIFGTAVGTEGHTGRHTADDYFHILAGTQLAFTPGEYEPEVYPQGSMHHLKRGEVKQYKMEEKCFALEYARGWIPPMLFFGYADGLFSTVDYPTLWRTTWVTGREIVKNLLLGKI